MKMLLALNNRFCYEGENGGAPAVTPSLLSEEPAAENHTPAPGAEPDPAAPAAPAPAEPEAVEPLTAESFEIPEGLDTDTPHFNSFLETLNNADLSPKDRAQQLLSLQSTVTEEVAAAFEQKVQDLQNETREAWKTEARALPDIGGEALGENLQSINQALKSAGASSAFFEALDNTGMGDHPEMISLLFKLTRPFAEGAPIGGTPSGTPLSRADKMFGGNTE